MNRVILLLFVVAIVGAGIFAGAMGLLVGGVDTWTPREYVLVDGNCFVMPQGDPLYDAHYAQQVNPYNCNAYLVQEQANHTKAEARRINVDTTQGVTLAYAVLAVLVLLLGTLVVAIVRG